jgi:DNA polymerase III psi subunit
MTEQQRLAYLEALDITAWVPRTQAAPGDVNDCPERVRLGPGTGSMLMICERPDQSSGVLASDIARVFPDTPVWSWPDDSVNGPTVAEAVQESLFTGLVVFGRALAERLLGAEVPERLGPARVLVADDFETLGASAGARRELWRQLCSGGMVSAS